ncbi:MAG TPA: twin-arginine translocase TatA/TatE family subunit [Fodinibius sp.]|nr:twin-arginine translocase TatA/TatE family subunit [Fodinibius sp.]
MTFGATEIILIVGIIILFFGAKKIPELARGIGQGINEFKKTKEDEVPEDNQSDNDSRQ